MQQRPLPLNGRIIPSHSTTQSATFYQLVAKQSEVMRPSLPLMTPPRTMLQNNVPLQSSSQHSAHHSLQHSARHSVQHSIQHSVQHSVASNPLLLAVHPPHPSGQSNLSNHSNLSTHSTLSNVVQGVPADPSLNNLIPPNLPHNPSPFAQQQSASVVSVPPSSPLLRPLTDVSSADHLSRSTRFPLRTVDEGAASESGSGRDGMWYADIVRNANDDGNDPKEDPKEIRFGIPLIPIMGPGADEMRESAHWTVTPSVVSASTMRSVSDVFTVGVINTAGDRLQTLITFLRSECTNSNILDLNAVSSRSASRRQFAPLRSASKLPLVPALRDSAGASSSNHSNESSHQSFSKISSLHFHPRGSEQYTNLTDLSLSDIQHDEMPPAMMPAMPQIPQSKSAQFGDNIDPPLLNHPLNEKNVSSKRNSALSASGQSQSPSVSMGSWKHFGGISAPHNDLDALIILEPLGCFEMLELYRERTSEDALLQLHDRFSNTISAGFASCVQYLKHRIKHSVSLIQLVYFVTFALPVPNDDVCQKWYEWNGLRSESLREAVEQCKIECKESKMNPQFVCCATPISKGVVRAQGDGEQKEDTEYVQSTLPFQRRHEIAQTIIKKLGPRKKSSALFPDVSRVQAKQ